MKKIKILLLISLIFNSIGCFSTNSKNETSTPEKIKIEKTELEKIQKKLYTIESLEIVRVEESGYVPGELGEKQYYLLEKHPAPFEGILLNPSAMAFIIQDFESLKLRSDLALNKQRELDLNKLNLETDKLYLEIDAIEKKNTIISNGKDQELLRLQNINQTLLNDKRKVWKIVLYTTGGFIVGAAGGIIFTKIKE